MKISTKGLDTGVLCFIFSFCVSMASAQSDIVITEIMYNQPGNDTLEFIELYNNGSAPVNLNGFRISKGVDFTFPNFTLGASQYAVVAKSAALMQSFFGVTAFQWVNGGSLDNSGEGIEIVNSSGMLVDSVHYEDKTPWDTTADGYGTSLILCNPLSENAQGFNWSASQTLKGPFNGDAIYASPGAANGTCTDRMPPKADKAKAMSTNSLRVVFTEPVGASAENVANYSGLSVTSASRTASGDTVYLTTATPLVTGNYYTLTVNGISDNSGNSMAKAEQFKIVYNNTKANLVINEVFYHTPGTKDTLEFIEVYNNGLTPAVVGGYEFDKGISFEFPSMTISPGQYVVIAGNPAMVNSFFGITGTLTWKNSSLNNAGEKLSIINTVKDVIDSLTYRPNWSPASDGGGASLVLCNPASDNHLPSSWSDANTFAGTYDNVAIYANPGASSGVACIQGLHTSKVKQQQVTIYPNPSSGSFEVFLNTPSAKRIELFNASGKRVYLDTYDQTSHQVEIPEMNGLFNIMITDLESNEVYSTKVVLE